MDMIFRRLNGPEKNSHTCTVHGQKLPHYRGRAGASAALMRGAAEVTKGGDDVAQKKKKKKKVCPFRYLSDRKQTCPRYYYNY